jgi:hypothetical protein
VRGRRDARVRADLVWLVALTFGTWVVWRLFAVPHGGSQKLEIADLFVYFLPAYRFEAARLRAGALPFWNPYQAVGVPFLGMLQPGALYPARLLLLACSPTASPRDGGSPSTARHARSCR